MLDFDLLFPNDVLLSLVFWFFSVDGLCCGDHELKRHVEYFFVEFFDRVVEFGLLPCELNDTAGTHFATSSTAPSIHSFFQSGFSPSCQSAFSDCWQSPHFTWT